MSYSPPMHPCEKSSIHVHKKFFHLSSIYNLNFHIRIIIWVHRNLMSQLDHQFPTISGVHVLPSGVPHILQSRLVVQCQHTSCRSLVPFLPLAQWDSLWGPYMSMASILALKNSPGSFYYSKLSLFCCLYGWCDQYQVCFHRFQSCIPICMVSCCLVHCLSSQNLIESRVLTFSSSDIAIRSLGSIVGIISIYVRSLSTAYVSFSPKTFIPF